MESKVHYSYSTGGCGTFYTVMVVSFAVLLIIFSTLKMDNVIYPLCEVWSYLLNHFSDLSVVHACCITEERHVM
jgi:hypothetical protein